MRTKIVTSFNAPLWHKYGAKCIGTWVEFMALDEGSEIEVWINGAFPQGLPLKTKSGTPFVYKSLDVQSEGWKHFFDTFRNHPVPEVPENQRYRYNFIPFSCKVYALAESAALVKPQWDERESDPDVKLFTWIDADVLLKKTLTTQDLSSILGNHHLAWLDRGESWGNVGETGFIIAKTNDLILDLFSHQANIYGSGQLFYLREWHDAFVLSSCIRYKEFTDGTNFTVRNLNVDMDSLQEQGLYPFKTSILNEFFDHAKGNLKDKIE